VSFRAVVTEVSAPASVSWIKIASKMNRIIFAIILQALALGGVAQAPEPPTPEQQLLTLLNLERRQAHLTVFQWDAKVAEAAQAHSQMLANRRMLSHQFAGEPELMRRVSSTGARFSSVAENVAVAADAEEAHLALMMSPGHRANILNPDYNAVGISVARVNKEIYVTEDFAHVVAAYSAEEFRQGVIAAFNRMRVAHRLGPIDSHADAGLDQEACKSHTDLERVLLGTSQATRATMFNATEPDKLPPALDQAASDVLLHRMSIGVCFRSGPKTAFPDFSVIVAFYQIK